MTLIKPCLSAPEINTLSGPEHGPLIPVELQNEAASASLQMSGLEKAECWLRANGWKYIITTATHMEYRRAEYSIVLAINDARWYLWYLPEYTFLSFLNKGISVGHNGCRAIGMVEFIEQSETFAR